MKSTKTYLLKITGLVQGVGFRPFIYKLAGKMALTGRVENRNDGVYIKVQGSDSAFQKFIKKIKTEAPPAAQISNIDVQEITTTERFTDFKILASKDIDNTITQVSPDLALCEDCLAELQSMPKRINYPFINCTNCGPRFSIVKDLPYDRKHTTMSDFKMCKDCAKEYLDPLDRRFHAQPNACELCGPQYTLLIGKKKIKNIEEILQKTGDLLLAGKIVAIKGLGGFHLACDALNNAAVLELRRIKNREAKPFAVLFPDIETIKKYAIMSPVEETVLTSIQRPIVLLKKKKDVAESVTQRLNTIGAMLPYTPMQHLLFIKYKLGPLVLTSGNISDEPIIIDNDQAIKNLGPLVDGVLVYNREIYNRNDDSVVMVVNEKSRIIRRSRGYAPSVVTLNGMNVEGLIAVGAEQKNCFAVGKGNEIILSQYI
ncbi:MAG: carbamoyltransferase HypF, partial [Candidatus Margulisbacteria bacterium]|nr:carbamoyltransferase HypF [Candidatus Margulisiibacteriota bacterium]